MTQESASAGDVFGAPREQPLPRGAHGHAGQQLSVAPITAAQQSLLAALFIIGVVLVASVSAVVGGVTVVVAHSIAPGNTASDTKGIQLLGDSVQRVAARVVPSVVKIETTVGGRDSEGSGIILRSDGLILTNHHVVAIPDPISPGRGDVTTLVTFADGRTAPFTIVGADSVSDIAIVRVQDISGLVPIEVGSSAHLTVGQKVVAVGAPLGLEGTVTTGIISAVDRPVATRGVSDTDETVLDAIQTDAAINPGNSGGALVDMSGALIGVNSASATTGGDYINGPGGSIGLGFAIPVDETMRIVTQLVDTGKAAHAALGVQVDFDSRRRGADIVAVTPGGPAAAAGLSPGALITAADHRVIADGAGLVAALRSKIPGDVLTVTYTDPSDAVRKTRVVLGSE
jgi:putative serine protease PepD